MLVVTSLLFFLTFGCIALAMTVRQRKTLAERLAIYTNDVEEVPERELESASERLIGPLFHKISALVGQALPKGATNRLDHLLVLAGRPGGLTAGGFILITVMMGIGLPGFMLFAMVSNGGAVTGQLMFLFLSIIVMGSYMPLAWLRMRIRMRKTAIGDGMAEAIDLILVSVEAGLALEAALSRVAEKIGGPLGQELRRTLLEMSMGKRRREAFRDLVERTEAPYLTGLVSALIQADQMGISLGQVLRVQSDQIRTKRRQTAEQEAMRAPVKMLFPLILFIFPSLFMVILGPAVISFMNNFQ